SQVEFASSMLQGRALTWWNTLVQTRGWVAAIAQPWEDFKKLLMVEYYPDDEIQKLKIEFWNHKMVGSDIDFSVMVGNFDVTVGMDWVRLEILEVHREWPKGNLKQLKTVKVNELKLKDIPVVRNFPSVFPKDLSSLPPSREVEFCIDLIPRPMPVAKSPYLLAPTEMQELSNQLKELQDKDLSKEEHEVHLKLILELLEKEKLRFITNFSKIAKPLTLLTQKNKKFEWGDEQEDAFQTLKDMLCDAPILALPEGRDDFVVYCDASNQGKVNVVADALSKKECMKSRRTRAMCMKIHSNIKARVLEAQSKVYKDINTPSEMLRGLEEQFERKEDGGLYFVEQI
ncbi:putative reverse transcriptase domain-containing protein, partial [Tanacetum coccineum]